MKKKVGTVLEERVLREAKARASREGRPLAALLQEALEHYLGEDVEREQAIRACERFCAKKGTLSLEEINEILAEETLSL